MPRIVLQSLLILGSICLKACSQYDSTISVDPYCLDSPSARCANLSYALNYNKDSTRYLLSAGEHMLIAGMPNTIANRRNITIASNGTSSTVRCMENAGLSFENVSTLVIKQVVFLGCGTFRNSTSRDLSDTERPYTLLKLRVALYFYLCESVTLSCITVTNSSGMGVLMYDTTGENSISNSIFSYNVAQYRTTPGGGGFSIEFTYTAPGDGSSPSSLQHNTGSMYEFVNCTFSGNAYVAENVSTVPKLIIIPYEYNHDVFGKGGGLALFFKGTASGNTVSLSNCTFQNNRAIWGGGLYAEFHDAAMGNVIEINRSTFSYNSATVGGGGLRVAYYTPGYNRNIEANNVLLRSSTFVGNNAFMGGATALLPSLLRADDPVPEILVSDCTFESNKAELGSAVYGSYVKLSSVVVAPVIAFQMCEFTNNNVKLNRNISEFYTGIGAVYLNGIPAKFSGIIMFGNNTGSALAVVGAYVDFSSSNVSFFNNTGEKGGGISLLGHASMLISNQTIARFEGNNVSLYGGAIYNSYIERELFSYYPNCFIQYDNFSEPPDKWTAQFFFKNNTAKILGNSIYSTSVLPCSLFTVTPNSSSKVFCWNQTFWNYDKNCSDEIGTGFGYLQLTRKAETFPGHQFQLPIEITDELRHDILGYTPFIPTIHRKPSQPEAGVDPGFYVAVDGVFQINGTGNENITYDLTLEGTDMGHWSSSITVDLLSCPPGFSLDTNNEIGTCKCDPKMTFNSIVVCLGGNSENVSLIKVGYWIGKFKASDSKLVVAPCPQGFCKLADNTFSDTRYVPLRLNSSGDWDSLVCAPNRMGIVCSKCIASHAPAINDDTYECVPCNSSQLVRNAFKYIGIVYVPLVLFFLVIILFNIKLTTGPVNAFILFSQVIISSFDTTLSGQLTINGNTYEQAKMFMKVCSVVYRIFNLDFFAYLLPSFCIGTELSTLDVIVLNYVVAIMPCIMILIVMACYHLKRLSCVNKICRCNTGFMDSQTQLTYIKSINISPVMAFAAFLLLAYNKFSATSSQLFRQGYYMEASGSEVQEPRPYYASQYDELSWKYLFPSIIVSTLIVVLPIILLGFPVRLFERCISHVPVIIRCYPADKVNIFLDAFQGCFKDNRRYFASAYFFFRLAINLLVFLPASTVSFSKQCLCIIMVVLIAFLQPYKVSAFNYVDILFFSNLAFISIFNEYIVQHSTDIIPQNSINIILVILCILISLPLIYMVGYLIWNFLLKQRKDKIVSTLLSLMQKYLGRKARGEVNTAVTFQATRDDDKGNAPTASVIIIAANELDAFDAREHEQGHDAGKSDTAIVPPSN